jgi:N-methylhydantoinase A/oxoprolinase/acetone carboxylase beta subunit
MARTKQETWVEIGIDIGGTFTDFVCRVSNQPDRVFKVPSTPDDPSRAVLDGIAESLERTGLAPDRIHRVVHGTTVATNAVLERKGALTGLITTAGFRDVLELGRQIRAAIYDLELDAETPVFLAPRARRMEVRERIAANGEVVVPLVEADVDAAADALISQGCEAIAICFLFSFQNPEHERRAAQIVAARHPGVTLSLSCEVDPAFREYERAVVTTFDAYVKPVLSRYLLRMAEELAAARVRAPLQVMQSLGGVSAAGTSTRRPVRLFLSGPAAGVIGAGEAARAAGVEDVITVDIGGTSCDIALVSAGKPLVRPDGRIDGYPVRVPMVDVNAIGSGGGSIAWIDAAGGLRVGPDSAGADPGPACYGHGGERPTVTDASLVLGFLNPEYFAGGSVPLHPHLAERSIRAQIAEPMGLSVMQAAHGIHRVVNAQMAEGMRLVSIRQGFDPRSFTLVALGGAGPVHAVPLAEELDIETIVVPRHPGVLSAAGLLSAPIEHEVAMGFPNDLEDTSVEALRSAFKELDSGCARLMEAEEVAAGKVRITHAADVCYVGQSHYLQVEVNMDAPDPIAHLYRRFIETHEQVFGYATESPARLVNLRSAHRAGGSDTAPLPPVAASTTARPKAERFVVLGDPAAPVRVPVVDRSALGSGQRLDGPVVIEQTDTTTVVHEGWCARAHDGGHLLLTRQGAES